MTDKTRGDGEMTKGKKDRVEINTCLYYASMYYSVIKNNFVSNVKTMAKEKYGIELTHELEKLLETSYKIGFVDAVAFADAVTLGIDRGDHDEPYGEEQTCKPRATTAR